MSRLLFFVFLAAAAWWLYRRFTADARRLSQRSARERKERQTGAVGTLEKDPVTGEYRVKRKED